MSRRLLVEVAQPPSHQNVIHEIDMEKWSGKAIAIHRKCNNEAFRDRRAQDHKITRSSCYGDSSTGNLSLPAVSRWYVSDTPPRQRLVAFLPNAGDDRSLPFDNGNVALACVEREVLHLPNTDSRSPNLPASFKEVCCCEQTFRYVTRNPVRAAIYSQILVGLCLGILALTTVTRNGRSPAGCAAMPSTLPMHV